MTYADLDGEINRMARLLINCGAGPGKDCRSWPTTFCGHGRRALRGIAHRVLPTYPSNSTIRPNGWP